MKASRPQLVIAALVIAAIFGLAGATLFFPINSVAIQVEDMLLGALIYAFKDIIGWLFGKRS